MFRISATLMAVSVIIIIVTIISNVNHLYFLSGWIYYLIQIMSKVKLLVIFSKLCTAAMFLITDLPNIQPPITSSYFQCLADSFKELLQNI